MPARNNDLFKIGRRVRIRDGPYRGNFGQVIGWCDGELDVFLSGGQDWPVRIDANEAEPAEKSEPRAVRLVHSDSRFGSD